MSRIEKNIMLTLIGGGIIALGIYYKKSNAVLSTLGIGIGITILIIGYLIINGETPEQKFKRESKEKTSFLSDGISKNKKYEYLFDKDIILQFDKKIGNNYLFTDQYNDILRIKKENLSESIK